MRLLLIPSLLASASAAYTSIGRFDHGDLQVSLQHGPLSIFAFGDGSIIRSVAGSENTVDKPLLPAFGGFSAGAMLERNGGDRVLAVLGGQGKLALVDVLAMEVLTEVGSGAINTGVENPLAGRCAAVLADATHAYAFFSGGHVLVLDFEAGHGHSEGPKPVKISRSTFTQINTGPSAPQIRSQRLCI